MHCSFKTLYECWSVLLGNFIKNNVFISEEWVYIENLSFDLFFLIHDDQDDIFFTLWKKNKAIRFFFLRKKINWNIIFRCAKQLAHLSKMIEVCKNCRYWPYIRCSTIPNASTLKPQFKEPRYSTYIVNFVI